jgi:dipeptidase E
MAVMRMLLTSNGVTNDPIRTALLDLLGQPFDQSKVVVIIDAILPFAGDNRQTLIHLEQLSSLGWQQFDLMSLFGGPHSVIEQRLRSADVIYCYGGSNHWLAHAWIANGFAPLLRELLDEKVYLGLSAGSMIFSRLHNDVVEAFNDQEEIEMLQLDSAAPALPLFDWALMPHLGASYFPDHDDDWAAAGAGRLAAPAYFLDDESALLVRDAAADPEVISNGHWLRFGAGGRLVDSR